MVEAAGIEPATASKITWNSKCLAALSPLQTHTRLTIGVWLTHLALLGFSNRPLISAEQNQFLTRRLTRNRD